MNIKFIFVSILATALLPAALFAQLDEREPGIYAVIGEESIPLPYTYGSQSGGSVSVGLVGVGSTSFNYKGETSGLNASGTFVLVVDPNKKVGTVGMKNFNCFLWNITPDDMLILPLETNVKKHRREYNPGTIVGFGIMGATTESQERPGYEWEQISDNSFSIKINGFAVGEYGMIFRLAKLGEFFYNGLFGFTIPEPINVGEKSED